MLTVNDNGLWFSSCYILRHEILATQRGRDVLEAFGWRNGTVAQVTQKKELYIYSDEKTCLKLLSWLHKDRSEERAELSLQHPLAVTVFVYLNGRLPKNLEALGENQDFTNLRLTPVPLDRWIEECTSVVNALRPIDLCFNRERHVCSSTIAELRKFISICDIEKAKVAAIAVRHQVSSWDPDAAFLKFLRNIQYPFDGIMRKYRIRAQFDLRTELTTNDNTHKAVFHFPWKGPSQSRIPDPTSITESFQELGNTIQESIEKKAEELGIQCKASVDVCTSGTFDMGKLERWGLRATMDDLAEETTFPASWTVTFVARDVKRVGEPRHARPPPPAKDSEMQIVNLAKAKGKGKGK